MHRVERCQAFCGQGAQQVKCGGGVDLRGFRRRAHAQRPRTLREAQRLGYAVDRQKLYLDIVAIAVVITDDQGQPRYGISAIQLADQTNSKKIRSIGGQLVKLASVFSSPPPSR